MPGYRPDFTADLGYTGSSLDPTRSVSVAQTYKQGLEELKIRLLYAAGEMSRKMAQMVSDRSQELCPRETGELMDKAHYMRPVTEEGTPGRQSIGEGIGGGAPTGVIGTVPRSTPSGGRYRAEALLWEVGYDTDITEYAWYVHENIRGVTFQKPGAEDHFLQKARDQMEPKYPGIAHEIVAREIGQPFKAATATPVVVPAAPATAWTSAMKTGGGFLRPRAKV